MKSARIFLLIAASVFLLTGCSKMYFHNGSTSSEITNTQWHHNLAFRLAEVSKPVDVKALCEGKGWQTVKTERTVIDAIAGSIDSAIIFVDVWDPWTVGYSCLK